MPRGDGSGTGGQQGPRTVGGRGQGAPGPGGYCVCTSCGERIPHERGKPCNNQECPSCGAAMIRE
jgi:hypothetical protein